MDGIYHFIDTLHQTNEQSNPTNRICHNNLEKIHFFRLLGRIIDLSISFDCCDSCRRWTPLFGVDDILICSAYETYKFIFDQKIIWVKL